MSEKSRHEVIADMRDAWERARPPSIDRMAAALSAAERNGYTRGHGAVDAEALIDRMRSLGMTGHYGESLDSLVRRAIAMTHIVDASALRADVERLTKELAEDRESLESYSKTLRETNRLRNVAERERDAWEERAKKAEAELAEARASLSRLREPPSGERLEGLAVVARGVFSGRPDVRLEPWSHVALALHRELVGHGAGEAREHESPAPRPTEPAEEWPTDEAVERALDAYEKATCLVDQPSDFSMRAALRAAGPPPVYDAGALTDEQLYELEKIARRVYREQGDSGMANCFGPVVRAIASRLSPAPRPSTERGLPEGFGPDRLTRDELKTLEMIYCDILTRDGTREGARMGMLEALRYYETLRAVAADPTPASKGEG